MSTLTTKLWLGDSVLSTLSTAWKLTVWMPLVVKAGIATLLPLVVTSAPPSIEYTICFTPEPPVSVALRLTFTV